MPRHASRHRWYIVALLFAASAISYIDRQTMAVLAPVLRDEFGLSNLGYARIVSAFLLAYTVMQPITGWMIDRVGTRRGFALIMGWWSAASMLHATGSGVWSFSVLRLLLGAGEAGSWSASVRAVSEWFPKRDRGFANGIWGAGTSVGIIVAVPVVAWIADRWGWRAAFVATGLSGFTWLAVWLPAYRAGEQNGGADPVVGGRTDGVAPRPSFLDAARLRPAWALLAARFFSDPVVWFYNSWVPEFLKRSAGFSLADIGRYGWIPFVAQLVGILLGGLLSDVLCRRGWRVVHARVAVMLAGVLIMTCGGVAALPVHVAVALTAISLAVFGFGLWAPNMMSLFADAFPPHLAGSVTGLSGIGSGMGGVAYTLAVGWMLDRFGFGPVFVSAATIPLLAGGTLYVFFYRPFARTAEAGD